MPNVNSSHPAGAYVAGDVLTVQSTGAFVNGPPE